ncbi:MAG: hypothetical protein MJZ14_03070 [Paludibacteraceae bacterium]|nr:hypothetical protein [Paludibacteraceae bacterium]
MEDKEKNELDLLDILKSIGIGIKKGFFATLKGLGWLCRLIYKYKYLTLGCLVLMGVVCAYQNRTKIYKGEADLKLISFPSYFVKNLLDPIHSQCVCSDSVTVARKLNLSEHDASMITAVKSYYYVDIQNDGTPDFVDYNNKFDMNDTTMSILPWKIRVSVETRDTSVLAKLADAFLYAITNNSQVKKENALRIEHLEEKIQMVDREILLLDSLRRREYFEKKKDVMLAMDKTVMLNEREMKLYHNDLLELEKTKQDLVWERKIYDICVSFENDFEVDPRPINRWTKTYPKYMFLGLLIAIALACLYESREKINKFLNKEI